MNNKTIGASYYDILEPLQLEVWVLGQQRHINWHQETDYPYRKRWKGDGVKKVEAGQKSLEGPSYPENPPASSSHHQNKLTKSILARTQNQWFK